MKNTIKDYSKEKQQKPRRGEEKRWTNAAIPLCLFINERNKEKG